MMSGISPPDINAVFDIDETVESVQPFGRGHINTTFRVQTHDPSAPDYLLQLINPHVFKNIPKLMHNIELVTTHIQQSLKDHEANPHLQTLTLIPTHDRQSFFTDTAGNAWRLYRFIDNAVTHDLVTDPLLAKSGAAALGEFQQHLADMDHSLLHETIPNFHHLPTRLQQLQQTVASDDHKRSYLVEKEIEQLLRLCETLKPLLAAVDKQQLPFRVTHNDTKFNNILFTPSGEAICLIDLDTVMPGLAQYDFSDVIRTAANSAQEDEPDINRVFLNSEIFTAITTGFLQQAHNVLTEEEIRWLAPAAHLLPTLLGLRFLTDYLSGDTYFRIHHPEQNLHRARCQIKLAEDIQQRRSELQSIVEQQLEIFTQ